VFGIYTSDFLQGTRDESQRLRGERQKIADAFQQFKAQNPEATYGDFRAFVDNMSDGSNYLRGALPADQLLQELGRQGERNKADSLRKRQTEALIEQTRQGEALSGLIGKARSNGTRDVGQIVDFLVKDAGIKDADQEQQFRSMILNANPQGVLDRLDREEFDSLLSKGVANINAGLYYDQSALADFASPSLKGTRYEGLLSNQLGNALDQQLSSKKRALMREGLQDVVSLADDATPETVMGIVRDFYGANAPTEILEPLAKELWDRASIERQREAENHGMRLDQYRVARDTQLVQSIKSDPAIAKAVQYAPENAKELIRRQVSIYLDDEADIALATDSLFKEMQTAIGSTQAGQYEEMRKNVPSLIQKDAEANFDAVGKYMTDAVPANLKTAFMTVLSQGNYINPGAVSAIIDDIVSKSDLADAPASALAQHITENYPTVVMSSEARGAAMLEAMGASKPRRLEDALAEEQGNTRMITANGYEELDAIEQATRLGGGDPRLQLQELDNLERGIEADIAASSAEYERLASDLAWSRVDSAIDPAAFKEGLESLRRERDRSIRPLLEAIARQRAYIESLVPPMDERPLPRSDVAPGRAPIQRRPAAPPTPPAPGRGSQRP